MIKRETIEACVKEFCNGLPNHFTTVKQELSQSLQFYLEDKFAKLNLVTREEFDAQVAILERLQDKIQQLEEELTTLNKN